MNELCLRELRAWMICENTFTHTAFTRDEYAQVGGSYLYRHVQSVVESGRIADDAKTVFY